MKQFEQYIRDNKQQLDTKDVDQKIWLNIENQMLHNQNHQTKRKLWWTIGISTVLVIGLLGALLTHQSKSDPLEIIHMHQKESKSYTHMVSFKTAELQDAMIPANRKEDFDLLLMQLEFLDDQYQDYLQYVEKNGYQEFIGSQILDYYKTKVELLDKIQQEIKTIDYYENKHNNKSDKVNLFI